MFIDGGNIIHALPFVMKCLIDVYDMIRYNSLGGANMTLARPDQSQRTIFIHFRGTVKWKHSNSFPSLGIKKGPSETYSRGVRAKIKEHYQNDKLFFIAEGASKEYHLELVQSVFCLAPLGFASWSGR
jgi:hypothetical protein